MPLSKPRRAAPLAWLVLAAAAGVARPSAAATTCFEAISGASAQKLFDALAPAKPSDGCTLENVTTDKTQMKVEWKKGGRLVEAILIVPTSCVTGAVTPAKMSVIVPSSVDAACPVAVAEMKKLVEGGTLGDLVPLSEGIAMSETDVRPGKGRRRLVLGLVGGGLVLAASIGGALFAVRRRKRKAGAAVAQAPKEAEGGEAVTMGETPKPPAQPLTMGETPKPPAQPLTMGETPKPPAQPLTMGETPKPPAQPLTMGETPKPPAQPLTMGETPKPPAQPLTMGETPKPPAQPLTMGETPDAPADPLTTGETPEPPAPPEP